jgi:acetyl esterase/lipase
MIENGISAPLSDVITRDIMIPGPGGSNPARVYRPDGTGPFPVILYFHGGGWVIADLDTYDATPRSMASLTRAIVISAHYRQAPEHKFPSAHADANAAYDWVLANAVSLGGDPRRVAVMGESAGANLAINVSIYARNHDLPPPAHQVLIYPVAGTDPGTESYHENSNAKPLNRDMMLWFFDKVISGPQDKESTLLNLVKADLNELPPTTVITAGIDPLRSEGEFLVECLRAADVAVEHEHYEGATHEFFGMANVVQAARYAQAKVAANLRAALGVAAGAPLAGYVAR